MHLIFGKGKQRAADRVSTDSGTPPTKSTTSHPVGCEVIFVGSVVPIVADIVFIHGLGGHRRDTWTKGKIFWPKDLLSTEPSLSQTRILTFGYDANIVGLKDRPSLNSLFKHSVGLLNELYRKRGQDARDRPLIFIAHSLGGLIVKDALDLSERARNTKPHLGHIFSSTRAVIFLGTPHRGSGMASLAKVMSTVLRVFMRTNRDLVQDLERDSQTLDRLRDGFSLILAKGCLSVWSFEEELAMPGIGKVVSGDSAVIGDARENRDTIHADHVGMTKFSTRDDDGYGKILHAIEISLEGCREDQPVISNQRVSEVTTRKEVATISPPLPLSMNQDFQGAHISTGGGDVGSHNQIVVYVTQQAEISPDALTDVLPSLLRMLKDALAKDSDSEPNSVSNRSDSSPAANPPDPGAQVPGLPRSSDIQAIHSVQIEQAFARVVSDASNDEKASALEQLTSSSVQRILTLDADLARSPRSNQIHQEASAKGSGSGNSTLTDTSPSVSIHKRTLDSGIYTITNLGNFNWAVLSNNDDNSDVVAGCSADEDAGEKWIIQKHTNAAYLLRNQRYDNYATYHQFDDMPTVLSTRTSRGRPWKIVKLENQDAYVIFNQRKDLCWTLRYEETGTPVTLEEYEANDDNQHWTIISATDPCKHGSFCVQVQLESHSNSHYAFRDGQDVWST